MEGCFSCHGSLPRPLPLVLCRMFLSDTHIACPLIFLRELEHWRDDSGTWLVNAKTIAQKDEARHEFCASTSKHLNSKLNLELLRLSTRLYCIILSILSMPKRLDFRVVPRHEWECKPFLTNISWDRDIHCTRDSHLLNLHLNLLIIEY